MMEAARPGSARVVGCCALSRRTLILSCGSLMLVGQEARAEPLPGPRGQVILTVTGAIGRTNASGMAELDLAMLEGLGLHELTTWTPWTNGETEFAGVLASRLLSALDAHGSEVVGTALNDYKSIIPFDDFDSYDVLLATRMNGTPLRIRNKGPIWVIYPWSQYPELNDEVTRRKSVWQLNHLHVR
jgi:hypothetical protein